MTSKLLKNCIMANESHISLGGTIKLIKRHCIVNEYSQLLCQMNNKKKGTKQNALWQPKELPDLSPNKYVGGDTYVFTVPLELLAASYIKLLCISWQ